MYSTLSNPPHWPTVTSHLNKSICCRYLGIPADEITTRDALTLLAMYLSAIIHDYDHRGVTNAFLIQDEDPLAVSHGCYNNETSSGD